MQSANKLKPTARGPLLPFSGEPEASAPPTPAAPSPLAPPGRGVGGEGQDWCPHLYHVQIRTPTETVQITLSANNVLQAVHSAALALRSERAGRLFFQGKATLEVASNFNAYPEFTFLHRDTVHGWKALFKRNFMRHHWDAACGLATKGDPHAA